MKKKCSDNHCKYIVERLICPNDWFDNDTYAECGHSDAPAPHNYLGCSDSDKYLDLPNWCPLRKQEG